VNLKNSRQGHSKTQREARGEQEELIIYKLFYLTNPNVEETS